MSPFVPGVSSGRVRETTAWFMAKVVVDVRPGVKSDALVLAVKAAEEGVEGCRRGEFKGEGMTTRRGRKSDEDAEIGAEGVVRVSIKR